MGGSPAFTRRSGVVASCLMLVALTGCGESNTYVAPPPPAQLFKGQPADGFLPFPTQSPDAVRVVASLAGVYGDAYLYLVRPLPPGIVAHLKILRNGDERDLAVTLGELRGKSGPSGTSGLSESSPMHGVQVDNLTPAVARDLGLEAGIRGVVVTDVADGTPASDAGLQRDDVIEEINHHPVTNVTDYERIVRQAGRQELVLLVNRGGQTSFLVVEPE